MVEEPWKERKKRNCTCIAKREIVFLLSLIINLGFVSESSQTPNILLRCSRYSEPTHQCLPKRPLLYIGCGSLLQLSHSMAQPMYMIFDFEQRSLPVVTHLNSQFSSQHGVDGRLAQTSP
jgi:hypothetical protein